MLLGDVFLATSKKIVVAWWGPMEIPETHILNDQDIDSIVCHPDEEDTLASTLACTGWIKLLVLSLQPKVAYDIYSASGEC